MEGKYYEIGEGSKNKENNYTIEDDENKFLLDNSKFKEINFSPNKELLIDKILSKGVCTKYSKYIYVCLFFVFLSVGMEDNLMNTIVIPIQKNFDLSQSLLEHTVSFLFLGFCIGSGLTGFLSEKLGRVNISFSLLLMFIVHLIMGFSLVLHLPIFIICRILIGILGGIIQPLSMNLFTEYLGAKFRLFFPLVLWAVYYLGWIILNILAYIILIYLEIGTLRMYICILSIICIISFLICIFLLNDSPRNLILQNDIISLNKSFKILNSMNGMELTNEEKIQIVNEFYTEGEEKKIDDKIKDLFIAKKGSSIIFLIIIIFIFSYNLSGILTINTIVLKKMIEKNNLQKQLTYSDKAQIIINQFFISVAFVILCLLVGIFGEIIKLRRKIIIIIFSLIACIVYFILPLNITFYKICSPIATASTFIFGAVILNYLTEMYQTTSRDMSTGFYMMIFRLFSFISQYICLSFVEVNYKIPYLLAGGLSLIVAIFSFILSYEVEGNLLY